MKRKNIIGQYAFCGDFLGFYHFLFIENRNIIRIVVGKYRGFD